MPEVRLIDATALKAEMEIAPMYAVDMYTACAVIDEAPTIEPEVRHTVLIRTGNDFVCGKCATTHRGCREDIQYCMRCGCKFDLGVKTYPDDYCKDDDGSGVGQTFSAD